ncbi:hypothetical protein ADH76_11575 [Enterocloster clostridioformis]|uniref:hypothetical protein n=1 Tax=Enterocloster clostridioformis TaxID=1531 RepID=UPI00080C7D43|nr:hypothetical protein [Enterocloster clostridioformis]ANU48249.1 hypothetical protein A4V08_23035 [Lachnoclostridium sp. YL32]NDO29503.1 hypothetical protein [Enterocloster clostridioformis]OXE69043.1 hypothetical protein ADH76_11575 [Enterocloster clostridioformis]QQR02865.1 hypothetical protein I5Q83_11780 [Enterocloster clostridioformis]
MNLLWDIVLRAQSCGKQEEDLLFRQAREYSPYYEQSFRYINEGMVESDEIELNLLYRFADIFQEILAEDGEDLPEFKKYFIDAALHVILYTDLRHGLGTREIYIRTLAKELSDGSFWATGAEEFALIPPQKQMRLATLALSQIQTGSSLPIFRRSVLILFPDALLYQVRAERRNLILYLADKPDEDKKRMLQFVQDMYLPLSYDLRIFWEHHFGIIGVDGTMSIDGLAIY